MKFIKFIWDNFVYWFQVKEADRSGDGVESLINRVESFLAQGKLSEAADALEKDLKGTQAGGVVDDLVKRARNRAIIEQALTLLQSYATTISITWNHYHYSIKVQFICCLQSCSRMAFWWLTCWNFQWLRHFYFCCNPSKVVMPFLIRK